jgi:hypothetical protein
MVSAIAPATVYQITGMLERYFTLLFLFLFAGIIRVMSDGTAHILPIETADLHLAIRSANDPDASIMKLKWGIWDRE